MSPAGPVSADGGAGGAGLGGAGAGGAQSQHMSTELVRTLWPMLEAVPGRMGGSPEVMRQLFLLVGKLLTSLRMVLAQQVHIPTLLKMIMDSYDEHQYPCCLDIMTTAVEVYGSADEAVEHFRALLGRASTRTFTVVQVRFIICSIDRANRLANEKKMVSCACVSVCVCVFVCVSLLLTSAAPPG